jgi:hypothetical protein
MALTNNSVSGTALLLVGSGAFPQYGVIGTGSATFAPAVGSMISEIGSRSIWFTRDITTVGEVNFEYQYNSIQMSGITLKEFGIAVGSTTNAQDLWNRETIPATLFDGSNELIIDYKLKVFK